MVFVAAVSTFAAPGVLVRGHMDYRAAADVCLPGCLQPYSPELLREFVAYARARVQPTLTPAAESRLIESYKDLRRQCSNEKVCVALQEGLLLQGHDCCCTCCPSHA